MPLSSNHQAGWASSSKSATAAVASHHSCTFGDDSVDNQGGFVDLSREETWSWRNEQPQHGAPHLSVWIDGELHESDIRDPDRARALAAALLDAADALEALQH